MVKEAGGLRLAAVNETARAAGLYAGASLADARALLPNLAVHPADPLTDRRALDKLTDWCGRYTPWTAAERRGLSEPEGEDYHAPAGAGLWLDVSGCAHLFGGEQALLKAIAGRLAGLGFAARAGLAETPGAAWAVARHDTGEATTALVPPNALKAALAPLPVSALRLPRPLVESLARMGLKRIGDLIALPRAPLAARFGEILLTRLDQALGAADEPLSPRMPVPAMLASLSFAEPIGDMENIGRATDHLLADLCARLEEAHLGARRLVLRAYRTDGHVDRLIVGTSRPVRAPAHLRRLFAEKLAEIDPGFGVEAMTLAATIVEPLAPEQAGMDFAANRRDTDLAPLVDRLSNRIGAGDVVRLRDYASHLPERACREVAALAAPKATADPLLEATAHPLPEERADHHRSRQPRPIHLLPAPEPVDVIAAVPDGPPAMVRWRRVQHRIVAADGPERIGPEWWRQADGHAPETLARNRDYYRVEDAEGRRLWLYREGLYRPDRQPRWYLHGLFA